MRILIILFMSFMISPCFAQLIHTDTLATNSFPGKILNRPLYSDSLSSSFIIVIKEEVKKHKHLDHTEHVYILDGTGEMLLGEKSFIVKAGDYISIPKGTMHALKVVKGPVKVISIQTPYFDGKDRIILE